MISRSFASRLAAYRCRLMGCGVCVLLLFAYAWISHIALQV